MQTIINSIKEGFRLVARKEPNVVYCPDCGRSEWTIRNQSDLQCNYCYGKFSLWRMREYGKNV